ncbi:Sas10 C-terminal domain-containing protein [Gorgonomyces haynaldii]|nr:Sas10 C-terminal domain-containing protein [Gorgonomyces haynaldii]
MARKKRSVKRKQEEPVEENYGRTQDLENLEMDEEDAFHHQRGFIAMDDTPTQDEDMQVLGVSDEDDEYYEKLKQNLRLMDKDEDEEEEEEAVGGWGRAKSAYYDARLEEQEALRLQSLQASTFVEEDFLDDAFEQLIKKDSKPVARESDDEEEKIEANVDNMSQKDKLRLVKQTMPGLLQSLELFKALIVKLLYLANLSFSLAVAASKEKTHPVNERLEKLAQLLEACADMAEDEQEDEEETFVEEEMEASENEEAVEESEEEEETPEEVDIPMEEYEPLVFKKPKMAKASDTLFGETGGPNDADLQDKQRRKKSLKFHVTRMEQSIDNNVKISGDDDFVPKQERPRPVEDSDPEMEEPMFDDNEPVFDDQVSEVDTEEDEDLKYYREITGEKQKKRQAREEFHAQLHEPLEAPPAEQSLEIDEKRKASYSILANRGLTPHRKKELRNPRVKHRKKYEKAQKKLSSFRRVAVDKSKLGAYKGEATGIKTDISRSTKL